MINPEPLKNKWEEESKHILYMKYGKSYDAKKLVSQDTIELFEDVKSAVEWLKKQCVKLGDVGCTGEGFTYLIDEAFENIIR